MGKTRLRTSIAASFLFLSLLTAAAAAPRSIELADHQRLAELSSPAASPDGQWIAYVVATADVKADRFVSTVWLRHWDGSGAREIRPAPGQSAWQPAFLPGGRGVAFLSDFGAEHGNQVWVAKLDGSEAHAVTALPGGVQEYDLAPDGQRLVAVGEVPGADDGDEKSPIVIDRFLFKDDDRGYMTAKRRHLFVITMASRQQVQLTHGDFDTFQPIWSPDGRRIVYVSRHEEESGRPLGYDLFCIDLEGGTPERRISRPTVINNDPDHLSRPAWSPDSRHVAYIEGGAEKWLEYWPWELVVADIETGKVQHIGKPDRGYTHPAFSADGKAVYALVEEPRNTYLSRIEIEGNRIRNLTQGWRFDFDLAVGTGPGPGERVALVSGDDMHPYRMSVLEGGSETVLPGHNDWLGELALAPVEETSFRSRDGTQIDGYLVRPIGYEKGRRYPTIVSVHGGPQYQFSHEFMFDWQIYAAKGYVVVGLNPRGSSGRGFKFSRAIWNDWGHVDVQDVLAATDDAIRRGVADPAHLGIGGWSYGGYLTDYTIASTRRFQAAVAGAGAGNVFGMYGADEYTAWLELEVGTPWKNFGNYVRLSYPFLHSDRIKTPTLFLCGQIDFNVPCIGSEQMYQALRSNKVPTRLVIYPNMHHSPDTPAFAQDRVARYLGWFDRYLKAGEESARSGQGATGTR